MKTSKFAICVEKLDDGIREYKREAAEFERFNAEMTVKYAPRPAA